MTDVEKNEPLFANTDEYGMSYICLGTVHVPIR